MNYYNPTNVYNHKFLRVILPYWSQQTSQCSKIQGSYEKKK